MNYPPIKPHRLTIADFREMELNAPPDERWELIDGLIVKSMSGGTKVHNVIVYNLQSALMSELRRVKSSCRAFSENVRLDIEASSVSSLPDIVVSCAPWTGGPTTVLDAVAIVEVLSPSTAYVDLGAKLSAYLTLPSLRTCVFVEQRRADVVVHRRSADGWIRQGMTAANDRLVFDGLDVSMTLAQVYEDIAFGPA